MVRFDWMAHIYDALAPKGDVDRLVDVLDATVEDRVLDLGGGTGRLSELFPGDVTVADLSLNMLRKARAKRPDLALARTTADSLPFRDGTFDRVVVTDAFHHFPDQDRCLDEMKRILAPGGRVVLQEFNMSTPLGKLIRFGERYVLWYRPLRLFEPEELVEYLEGRGFDASLEHEDHATYIVEAEPL